MKTQVEVWENEKYYTEAKIFFVCVLPIFIKGFFNLIHLGTQKMFSVSFLNTMKKRRRDSRSTDEFVLTQQTLFNPRAIIIYLFIDDKFVLRSSKRPFCMFYF